MDDVINRLIEADKNARKRVKEAKKLSSKAVKKLDAIKAEEEKSGEKLFEETIENIKNKYASILEEKRQIIEKNSESALLRLDEKFKNNEEEWANAIFNLAIEN